MNLTDYVSPPHATAFSGRSMLDNFYRGRVTSDRIRNDLETSNTYTQMRPPKKPIWNPTYTHTVGDQLQIDLMDMQQLRQYNRGIGYALICEDAFSRYAFFRLLKRKTAAEVKAAFEDIVDNDLPFRPIRLVHDDGSEWKSVFRRFCAQRGIQQTISRRHPAYVERLQVYSKLYFTLLIFIAKQTFIIGNIEGTNFKIPKRIRANGLVQCNG